MKKARPLACFRSPWLDVMAFSSETQVYLIPKSLFKNVERFFVFLEEAWLCKNTGADNVQESVLYFKRESWGCNSDIDMAECAFIS